MGFRPWDSIEPEKIKQAQSGLASLSEEEIRRQISEELPEVYTSEDDEGTKVSLTHIESRPLLGIDNAIVFAATDFSVGITETISAGGSCFLIEDLRGHKIPALISWGTPTVAEITWKHEIIHACQMLDDNPWPTIDELAMAAGLPAEKPFHSQGVVDSISRLCKHAVMELEAYYWSDGPFETPEAAVRYFAGVERSTHSYEVLEDISMYAPDDNDAAERLWGAFCRIAELEIPWLSSMLELADYKSLASALRTEAMEQISRDEEALCEQEGLEMDHPVD